MLTTDSAILTTNRYYPRLAIEGSGKALLSMSWRDGNPTLYLNGDVVETDPARNAPTLTLRTPEDDGPSQYRFGFSYANPASIRDENQRFFVETLKDLWNRLVEGDQYNLIKAAGLLRLLFLDDVRLVDSAQLSPRQAIRFVVADYGFSIPVDTEVIWRNPDLSDFPGARTLDVGIDQFLAFPILAQRGVVASVKDLIKVCANVRGGVHLGRTRVGEVGQRAVIDWDEALAFLGREPSIAAMAGLCRVVLRALEPLAGAIVERSSSAGT